MKNYYKDNFSSNERDDESQISFKINIRDREPNAIEFENIEDLDEARLELEFEIKGLLYKERDEELQEESQSFGLRVP